MKAITQKGMLCFPDFIANAGSVICAAMEYRGMSEAAALEAIPERVRHSTEQVLEAAHRQEALPREVAVALAVRRVRQAMGYRRWSLSSHRRRVSFRKKGRA